MKTKTRHFVSIAGAGALALAIIPQAASAAPIDGAISFSGSATPFDNTTGTGTLATDFSLAHSIMFSGTEVAAGANGSFSGIAQDTVVNMFSPLVINPVGLPTPIGTALWTVGGFTFTPTSLTEDTLVAPFNILTLRGTGTLSDGNPADNTTGTWVAGFTEANSAGGESFSFSSATQGATIPAGNGVPDKGTTAALLGAGLLSLGAFGYMRKGNVD